MLLPADVAYLQRQNYQWSALPEGGYVCLVVPGFRIPPGYQQSSSDLLVRLPPGFPDAQPDMWWFDPPLRIAASGAMPPNTDVTESYVSRTWQRWSRHFPAGAWRPGRSGVESYLTLIRKDLEKWVRPGP